jgi:two-component system, chemotaxis family, CheB/CheR fusion protein
MQPTLGPLDPVGDNAQTSRNSFLVKEFHPRWRSTGNGSVSISSNASAFVNGAGAAILRGDGFFRDILEALPAAVYITDAAGRIVYYNQAAAELWGQHPELGSSEWCGSWKLFWSDGSPLPHDQCPMALALKQGRAIRGMEAVAERPDGSRVPFVPFPTPLHDEDGTLIGAVNMLMDVSDRKRSDEIDRRLASIVESCDDAIVSKDLQGIIRSWNKGAERLFGYSAAEVLGRSITIVIPPERQDEEPIILERLRRGERIDHFETVRRRKDGTLVDVSLTVSPVKNALGEVIGASKVARDITEIKRARNLQKLFVDEMKHRIKNTLSMVQAIASQTIHSASECAAFGARLSALACAHDLLTIENWNRASLLEIADRALKPFQEQHRERLVFRGADDAWVDAGKASMLAMALHELATNAVKYGALSNATGHVLLTTQRAPDDHGRVVLIWQERGGPPVSPPKHNGFGSRLVGRALRAELGRVDLNFDPSGVVCRMEIESVRDQ